MPGLLRGIARTAVVAGTATAVSNRVSRRQAGRWARQDQQQADAQEPVEPQPATAGGMDDTLAQLKQLGELKSQGVLTEAEFQQQKSRILNA
ncbi:SHOCT domain-containing protein [Pseudonocardia sp. DSM 110487]|uniref:SHOCT domain-containing protein n=1 Tax=Pseudonocardia sp. DSM 110487 TaxID=2865833 RepID=UPI001C6943FA|nr:SHOCT domain-containing protein [Pseudonocardia sp. DSM 110487]QYN38870.1 SHOCT domain-containing protein [Pseudonocardia sp. DSM 110487]